MVDTQQELDRQFLSQALELAELGKYSCKPNPRVGCVIVKGGEVIGQGWHIQAGGHHAEVNAIADARNKQNSTMDATAYVSLEPCSFIGKTPPCVDALLNAQISRVVCASLDPNPKVAGKGLSLLISHGIEALVIEDPIIQSQAEYLNRGFFKRMRTGLPWVMLKTASSLDGKIADSEGGSQWITSEIARQDVHHLRAESCAIVTGSGTQVADNPNLNARLGHNLAREVEVKQPYRVLLDSKFKLQADANIIGSDGKLIVFTQQIKRPEWSSSLSIYSSKEIKLDEVLKQLADLELNIVIVEAGSILAGVFVESDLVDEIVHYIAPSIIGSAGRDMFDFSKSLPLTKQKKYTLRAIDRVGKDTKMTFIR